MTEPSDTDRKLRRILAEVLGLRAGQAEAFTAATGLFGELPELDSMAVAGLLTEIEDRLDIVIDEDEIDGWHSPGPSAASRDPDQLPLPASWRCRGERAGAGL
jgi:acyl carrier protein